jgi:hypothetical protein
MATDVKPDTNLSVSGLVTGIIDDAQKLVKQEADLIKAEIRHDFQRTKEAGLSMGLGGIVALVGAALLSLGAVHLLNATVPDLPLWACFGIVGGVLAVLGGVLLYMGKAQFASFNPLPDQSMQALKETVQWQTTPR